MRKRQVPIVSSLGRGYHSYRVPIHNYNTLTRLFLQMPVIYSPLAPAVLFPNSTARL